jgi:hypothetical protein
VSEEFGRKDCGERVALVYERLLEALHEPLRLPPGTSACSYADDRNLKGFSGAIGNHVLALPIFRNLSALNSASLIIECKTPGAWYGGCRVACIMTGMLLCFRPVAP